MKLILLVDDEDFLCEHLSRLIERHGYEVITASNGTDAIEIYRKKRPDCVFLDIMMPGLRGDEVLDKIKELDPQPNVYFLTGIDKSLPEQAALEKGAKGVVKKPIDVNDIITIIEAC